MQYSLQKGSSHLSVIDLHSHIVPSVDDGARTLSEAKEMIDRMSLSLEAGSTVVFTPHYSCSMNRKIVIARQSRSLQFLDWVEKENHGQLNFLNAGELMVQGSALNHMEEVRYPGTGWVLVEFNTGVTWIETLLQLRRLIKKGYLPLLAHPERYRWCRRKPERLIKLSKIGCGNMVSARSFRFRKYAAVARNLLREGLSHALCSDVHSPSDMILDEELKNRVSKFSRVPWEILTGEIPDMILNDSMLPELPLRKRRGQ